mmetsp:Transcript_9956/g.14349  ORF Transcript_9956/g.14349 Transcript_9956/m.14349 type:complete len:168 (-) Transcript_9956:494-997(-)
MSVCPFEVLKVRLQSKEYMGKYKNTLHCLTTVLREEGAATLYSGVVAHSWRNCIFNGTFFAGSFAMREHLFARPKTAMESFGADFVCGTVMGLVATPAKMPFMVVKTRLQAASGAKLGTFETMALIAKNEGVPALWKGTVPAATRMSLGGAVSLSCFRLFSNMLGVE